MTFPTKQQIIESTTTAVLTAIAVVYAAGQRLGSAYYANQDTVHEDLATFAAAVRTGTSRSVAFTLQLGRDTRAGFDVLYPVAKPRAIALYNTVVVRHNEVSDYLRAKLNLN